MQKQQQQKAPSPQSIPKQAPNLRRRAPFFFFILNSFVTFRCCSSDFDILLAPTVTLSFNSDDLLWLATGRSLDFFLLASLPLSAFFLYCNDGQKYGLIKTEFAILSFFCGANGIDIFKNLIRLHPPSIVIDPDLKDRNNWWLAF